MKKISALILMSLTFLSAISSCIPVRKGELRLLDIEIRDSARLRANGQFWVRVNFDADGSPEIRRACFFWTGDGPHCIQVKDVAYGSVAFLEVPLYARYGSSILQCYVEYLREEKIERSNTVTRPIDVSIP